MFCVVLSLFLRGFKIPDSSDAPCISTSLFVFKDINVAILSKDACKGLGLIHKDFPHYNHLNKISIEQSKKCVPNLNDKGRASPEYVAEQKSSLMKTYEDVFDIDILVCGSVG